MDDSEATIVAWDEAGERIAEIHVKKPCAQIVGSTVDLLGLAAHLQELKDKGIVNLDSFANAKLAAMLNGEVFATDSETGAVCRGRLVGVWFARARGKAEDEVCTHEKGVCPVAVVD